MDGEMVGGSVVGPSVWSGELVGAMMGTWVGPFEGDWDGDEVTVGEVEVVMVGVEVNDGDEVVEEEGVTVGGAVGATDGGADGD